MNEQNNTLIIIGAAPCVREDIDLALLLVGCSSILDRCPFDFMAIGLDAVDKYSWPVKYFVTYHPAEIEEAKERRKKAGGNTDYMVIAHQQHAEKATGRDLVGLIIPCEPPSGSSALLGVLAGIQLGYEKIIVCGCPLTGINDKGYDYANFRVGWTAKLSEIKDKTRAMSGWTKELLGAPDQEWLSSIVIPAQAGIQED
jgi:hypothetical protein